ncbi:RsmB/NOP family class I SAM-dependent RNA methyltransferase [Mongoliimonas terrestris]|uniref:RsmB/NOP family class I SAM-dependent RNA methyltransferase n=1 Tax=Mongoliimonas terrestris TaxID=1709001 RepID=UPI0009F92E46|nr:RsmB/NOP family class I SAM-dependent RNA methyltransferase [Mongoliimonas terrestris]
MRPPKTPGSGSGRPPEGRKPSGPRPPARGPGASAAGGAEGPRPARAGKPSGDKPFRPSGEGRPRRDDRPAGGPGRGGFAGHARPRAQGQVGLAARQLAVDLVATVQKGKLLDQLLDTGKLADRYQLLDPRDRGLVRAIVGITLRHHGQITDAIGRFLERPLPDDAGILKPAMAVAAAQVLFMDIADHAAVALGVEVVDADKGARPFKGLVNAVLRRIAGAKELILAEQDAPALNTPAWMMERWTATYGAETARGIAEMQMVDPSIDLTVKSEPAAWAERLGGTVLPNGTVRIPTQGAIEKLAGYDEGAWWVQDAAATFPVRLLGDVKGKKVADLCAAPGGKTALLAHLGATVTAVDVSGYRLARLQRNLFRLGLKADVLTADITEWLAGPFDMILLDAPCTATGTLRRHPDGLFAKGQGDVAALAGLQRKLIDQAIRSLKPGGLFVYSTCSLEPEEGPDQIRRLMLIDAPVERVPVTADEVAGLAEIVTPEGDIRTLPTHLPHADPRLSGLDGFYAARLRRKV